MRDKRHEILIQSLGKGAKFLNAFESAVGQELLKDATERMQRILLLVIDLKAEEKDLAEYRALRDITKKWLGKVAKYQEDMKKLGG